jgi:hypothetical protein
VNASLSDAWTASSAGVLKIDRTKWDRELMDLPGERVPRDDIVVEIEVA